MCEDERYPPCSRCGLEEATVDDMCRQCFIDDGVERMACEECGMLTHVNDLGHEMLGLGDHAEGCSKGGKWICCDYRYGKSACRARSGHEGKHSMGPPCKRCHQSDDREELR